MSSPEMNSTSSTAATSNSPASIWVPVLIIGCSIIFLAVFVYISHRFVICTTARGRRFTRDLENADELSIVKRLNKAACSQLYSAWKATCAAADETAPRQECEATDW
ncbi:hypothetical protein PLICBS_007734 [Purpureocillium lilacinum]|uniref:uncharacterized protein n=1 Tax=Purpureocillium lilacinum TaxID=33203 RepID=UPI00208918EA|nr:hypothetical protein PLICBS_007734 [Purpureocillium lilacinum]